jgi:hypothetical protein
MSNALQNNASSAGLNDPPMKGAADNGTKEIAMSLPLC